MYVRRRFKSARPCRDCRNNIQVPRPRREMMVTCPSCGYPEVFGAWKPLPAIDIGHQSTDSRATRANHASRFGQSA